MLTNLQKKLFGSIIPIVNVHGCLNSLMTQNITKRLQSINVKRAEALAVSINTTGGLPVQSQLIANKLKQFAKKNNLKLLTFGKDLVASGGYLILAAGDQVYCDTSSIIGNISVIIPKYGLKGVLDLFQIQHKSITSNQFNISSKLNSFNELKDTQRQYLQNVSKKTHTKLIEQIKFLRRGKISQKALNGQLYTGKQSKDLGLVDQVGSMIQILHQKYPNVKLEVQKETSIWNSYLKTK